MIPAHNCAGYLPEALREVVGQLGDRDDVEIVVVDDASDDSPERVVAEHGYTQVEVHRLDSPHGAIGNFNTCLRRSRGELVHVLHGDDAVLPGFYDAMEAALADEHVGAACCRTRYVDDAGRPGGETRSEVEGSGRWDRASAALTISNRIRPASIVVRRKVYETVGGFLPDLPHSADWEMWARIARTHPIYFVDETLAVHRRHTASDTAKLANTGANIADRIKAIDTITAELGSGRRRRRTAALLYGTAFSLSNAFRELSAGNSRAAVAQLRGSGSTLAAIVRPGPRA